MYSERHFRCLEGAGPARPHQPGFAAAAPGGSSRPIPMPRAAGSPRGPDGAQAVGRPRVARDAPPTPRGCSSRRPVRAPEGWAGAFGTPTRALAPLHLPLWASGPRRVRAAGSPRWFAEEDRAGSSWVGAWVGPPAQQ